MATNVPVTGDTPITIKISINDNSVKRLKLPLKDLTADVLPSKLRLLLGIANDRTAIFERFSDSVGSYVTLDPQRPDVFKTLIRAAKAKLKLRLKATVDMPPMLDDNIASGATAEQSDELLIARSPRYIPTERSATLLDGRSVGPGIFLFKDSLASADQQQTGVASSESSRPLSFVAGNTSPFTNAAIPSMNPFPPSVVPLALRTKPSATLVSEVPSWTVYCNECDSPMDDVHFHCSICDGGDFDLCESCVEKGKLCTGEGHWLVKRFIKDGTVISSTTERLPPKVKANSILVETSIKTEVEKEMPGAFTEDTKTMHEGSLDLTRTCNCCVTEHPDNYFVTCSTCEDFDLCLDCHSENQHGHHPAHTFAAATSNTQLSLMQMSLLPAGRNVRHQAICDGCDKNVYGVRHKCFTCPDFDYCSECVKNSRHSHPGHRFAALYEPIVLNPKASVRHHGIFCDGPACTSKPHQTYIEGVRYKCVVCHDTDFCAACEAMPGNVHNKTHPVIKIKTPIRGLNVSTVSENPSGLVRDLGDRKAEPAAEMKTSSTVQPSSASNATTALHTVADIKPTTTSETAAVPSGTRASSTPKEKVPVTQHTAIFVRDAVADGTSIIADTRFTQVWTLRNSGATAWPAGCSVRYVGGDNMLNIDNNHPSSASGVAEATETNVIGREVQPGEEVAFKIIMKAPTREGKAISYWRLKAADGTPFGHRLWCDIQVIRMPVKVKEPTTMHIGSNVAQTPAVDSNAAKYMAYLREQQQLPRLAPVPSAQTPATPVPQSYYVQYQQRMQEMRQQQVRLHAMQQQRAIDDLRKRTEMMVGQASAAAASTRDALHAMPWKRQMEDFVQRTSATPSHTQSKVSTPENQKNAQVPADSKKAQGPQASPNEALKGSQMIFPTLEKESPASSTYQSMTSSNTSKGKAAYVEDEETGLKVADAAQATAASTPDAASVDTGRTEAASAPPSVNGSVDAAVANDGFEDVSTDLEVLSADEADSEDDGFLTDEEYDILDASDQETVASAK